MRGSLFLLALAVLFFGCIQVEYHQKVQRDGSSVIVQTTDLSAILSLGNGTNEPTDVCINITKGETDISCTYEDGIINITKSFSAGNGEYEFSKSSEFPYIVYELEIRRLPQLYEGEGTPGSNQLDSDFKSPGARTSANTLKASGARVIYEIEMPGEPYSAENGKIEGGKAVYDVLELMDDGEYMVVKSRELDVLTILIAVLAVLGGLAVAGFVIHKIMKK